LLRELEKAGIGCPRAIAHGEADGRAFLLLREETGVHDLRAYLQERPLERVALATALGQELAHVHAAGFCHRDLYSKHVLVGKDDSGWRFCFLDWQRGRQLRRVTWLQRLRDLATLDATIAETIASRRERLLCWRAYLTAQPRPVAPAGKLLRLVCRLSARLQRKRRIRELRQAPLPAGRQGLIWLDGEALCVTPRFQAELAQPPAWLTKTEPASNRIETADLSSIGRPCWKLVRRWANRPWRWLASWWRRPFFPAPEFEQAAAIIRLERYGIETPRLLALGHRRIGFCQTYSFLLTETAATSVPLLRYLDGAAPPDRDRVLGDVGRMLRRMHEAGYACQRNCFEHCGVRADTGAVVLTSVEGVRRRAGHLDRLARKDLTRLASAAGFNAADRLHLVLGYCELERLTPPAQRLLRQMSRGRWQVGRTRRERRVA
jgi:tRNA A-37 threonylcarbamoyl transferase component Bud32